MGWRTNMASFRGSELQNLSPFSALYPLYCRVFFGGGAQIIINQKEQKQWRLMGRAGGSRPVVVRDVRCHGRVRSRAVLCWGQRRLDSSLLNKSDGLPHASIHAGLCPGWASCAHLNAHFVAVRKHRFSIRSLMPVWNLRVKSLSNLSSNKFRILFKNKNKKAHKPPHFSIIANKHITYHREVMKNYETGWR